jgi:hypothetical protein
MKKSLHSLSSLYLLLILGILAAPLAFGQVNRDELSNLGPVEFINYEGPYSRIETRAQIKAIGYSLGVMIRTGQTRAGGAGRYFVIHSVSPADGFKLDADIFGLGVDIGVDHVRNLRLIIQGYLEAAYSYTEKDAALLAEYITIYNAVYRGDLKYFSSRYKTPVMDNVTQDKAGLSIRYDEWPGRTLMLIPLGMGSAGPLNTIDTTPLTDSKVTEQLRQEPDRSVDTRKEMVDLKERQSEQAEQQANIQKEAIKEEEQKQAQQQQEAAQEKQQIAQERQDPNADQRALDQRQQAAEQKEQQAQQRQQELEQQKQEADQTQQYAEQKAEEAQQDREGIAADQQALINQQPVPPLATGVLGATILTPNASLGRVVKLNPDNGQEILRSGLNTVNARSITLSDGKIIAIAGENRGNGAVRLIQINPDTLEMIKQGDDDIGANSIIWVNGSDLYAITSSGGNLYLGRFNSDLERQARSSVTIHPFASVLITDSSLITQRADGTALLLNPKDLSEKR